MSRLGPVSQHGKRWVSVAQGRNSDTREWIPRPRWLRSGWVPGTGRGRGLRRGAEAGDEVDEAHDLFVAEGLGRYRHGPVQVGGRLGLEAAKELEEVVVILTDKARRLLLADESGAMAGGAVVKLGEAPSLGDLRGISGRRPGPRRLSLVIGGQVCCAIGSESRPAPPSPGAPGPWQAPWGAQGRPGQRLGTDLTLSSTSRRGPARPRPPLARRNPRL